MFVDPGLGLNQKLKRSRDRFQFSALFQWISNTDSWSFMLVTSSLSFFSHQTDFVVKAVSHDRDFFSFLLVYIWRKFVISIQIYSVLLRFILGHSRYIHFMFLQYFLHFGKGLFCWEGYPSVFQLDPSREFNAFFFFFFYYDLPSHSLSSRTTTLHYGYL